MGNGHVFTKYVSYDCLIFRWANKEKKENGGGGDTKDMLPKGKKCSRERGRKERNEIYMCLTIMQEMDARNEIIFSHIQLKRNCKLL